jgi:hypothetical protein
MKEPAPSHRVKKLKLLEFTGGGRDERAVHESRPVPDVTGRYITALTLSRATETGLLKTRVFNGIEFFAQTVLDFRDALPGREITEPY